MSRRSIGPFRIFNEVDISTNQTSQLTNIQSADYVGLIIEWTGTAPVGQVLVEVQDSDKDYLDTAWIPLEFGTSITITGNTGSHTVSINQPPFQNLRLRYVSSSGSGTLTASIHGRTVGA